MDQHVLYLCDPCKLFGNNVTALSFCTTCESFLCKPCLKAHRQSAENKGHKLVDADKAMAQGTVTKCDVHHGTIESVCESHDVLCCRQCIASQHRNCLAFTPIHRAAEGIHGTKMVQDTRKELEQLIARSGKTAKEEKEAATSIGVQGKAFEEAVKKFKNDVTFLLNQMEAEVLKNKDDLCADERAVVEERVKVSETVNEKLVKAGERLFSVDKKLDEQSAFIVMKKSRDVIEKYKDVVDELTDGHGKFSIKFEPNKDMLKAMDSIGSIHVKSTVQPFGAFEVKEQVEGRKLVQVGEFSVSSPSDQYPCTVTGCALIGDSKLVLADETNGSLKVLDCSLKLIADLKMEATPWDVSALSNDEVAVRSSFTENETAPNRIDVVKIGNDFIKKDRDFTVDGRPRAIKCHNSNVYIACASENKAHILVLKCGDFKVTKTIKPKKGVLHQPQYIEIAPSSQVIYISDFYNGIIALNLKGDVLFKFKDKNVTEYGGITMDTSGDLYICAGKPYGIYHVIKDGKALSSLTTWQNGSIDPQAIMYNSTDGTFIVTCCTSNKALIFCYEGTG